MNMKSLVACFVTIVSFGVLAEEQTVAYLAPDGNTHSQWIKTGLRLVGDARKTCTMEIWVYPLTRSYQQTLITQYGNNAGRQTFCLTSGQIAGGIVDCHMNGYDETPTVNSEHQVPLNQWSHIALVMDNGNWRIYVNGELDGEATVDPSCLFDATSEGFTIGNMRTSNPNGSSNAYFAEARVWTTARTQAQIKELMNKRIENAYLHYDLIGYWPLNDGNAVYEANGKKVRNHAGARNEFSPSLSNWDWCYASGNRVSWVTSNLPVTGTLFGDQYAWYINGQGADDNAKAGKALTTTVTDAPANYTLMGWFRITNGGFENVLFGKMGSALGRVKVTWTKDNKVNVWTGGGGDKPALSMSVSDVFHQVWTHVAVVKNGNNMKIYINGELRGESDHMPYALTNDRLTIGGFLNGTSSRGYSCCAYRNVGFWRKALDADAIRERMTTLPRANESGLIGYWPLDDGAGKTEARNLVAGGPAAKAINDGSLEWQRGANLPVVDGETTRNGMSIVVR